MSNGANPLIVAGSGATTINNFIGGSGGLTISGGSTNPTVTLAGTTTLAAAQTWANNSSNTLTVGSTGTEEPRSSTAASCSTSGSGEYRRSPRASAAPAV